jgi:hypothetical protein
MRSSGCLLRAVVPRHRPARPELTIGFRFLVVLRRKAD